MNPGRSASTKNAVSDREPAPGSVTAITCARSQNGALVIQALRPSSTQSPPSQRAVVVMPSMSEPPWGSVFANAAVISARTRGATNRCRCSAVA